MKKIFLIGLAATAMLASCSQDETVEMAQSKAIGFSNAFVNNGTRSTDPSFTTTTLENFLVWGSTEQGQIFDGQLVEKKSSAWEYDPLQYWVLGNKYSFDAIAPASVKNDVTASGDAKTIAFTNTGDLDLLYAAPVFVDASTAIPTNPVAFTFKHQLSKVKFSFVNALAEGYTMKVTAVKLAKAKQTGTLTVGGAWSAQAGEMNLDFGDATSVVEGDNKQMESANEKLMIPAGADAEYTVTFTAELFKGDVSMGTFNHETAIKNVELKLGYCYDFKATLTMDNIDPENPLMPIYFTVEDIEDWNNTEQDQEVEAPFKA